MNHRSFTGSRAWRYLLGGVAVAGAAVVAVLLLGSSGGHAGAAPGQALAADFAVLRKPFAAGDALPQGASLLRLGGDTGPVEDGSSVRSATPAGSPVAVWVGQAGPALCLHVSLDGGRTIAGGACQAASDIASRGGGLMVIPGTDTAVVALAPDGYSSSAVLKLPDGTERALPMRDNVAAGTVAGTSGGNATITLSGPDGDRAMSVPLGG